MTHELLRSRCLSIVESLAGQLAWSLDARLASALVEAILPVVAQLDVPSDARITVIATNYFQDGPMVVEMGVADSAQGRQLWAEWRGYFARYVNGQQIKGDDAEDLVQMICLEASVALARFRFEARLVTFFHHIARRQCAKWFKRQRRQPQLISLTASSEASEQEAGPHLPANIQTPDLADEVTDAELRRLILREIAQIKASVDFQILYLYYVEKSYRDETTGEERKWTDEAIGVRLGMPRNTVTSRRRRALRRLTRNPTLRQLLRDLLGLDAEQALGDDPGDGPAAAGADDAQS
jgi:RNA polymerase sigma factor (sigma-70 family)